MQFLVISGGGSAVSSAPAAMLAALALGYLLGSIPFGLLLTRAAGLGDVRRIGSGNIGATNVLRTGHKGLAIATLLLDGLKGTVAVVIAAGLLAPGVSSSPGSPGPSNLAAAAQLSAAAAGLGAFLGHIFPVWLGFRGGKGVATYIGVLVGLWWPIAVAFCGLWLVIAFATRYSSLSALVAAAATPIGMWIATGPRLGLLYAAMTALLFWKHRENIDRLLRGTEGKIGANAA